MADRLDASSDARLRVALANGIGPKTFARLVDRFGSCDAIVDASIDDLAHIEGIGRTRAERIRRELDEVDTGRECDLMERHGVRLLVQGDAAYPRLLGMIPDPPVALWVRGELLEADQLAIAIVGSRRCSAYGRDQTGRLSSLLAQGGLTIVSGGARGIDAEAHRASLRVEGRTIAVCGCGLAETYPPEHADLFARIAAGSGAIVSEYPMQTPPKAAHFPRRNRIISGLSLGVLVIEAGKRSGALITARVASEDQNREVMALPGRVDSPASFGCLSAIKDGWAGMVLNHADVLAQLESSRFLLEAAIEMSFDEQDAGKITASDDAGADGEGANKPNGRRASSIGSLFGASLTARQVAILESLDEGSTGVSVDELVRRTQIPAHELMAELTVLQIQRVISRDERGFRRARR